MTYVACLLADEHHTTSNKSLVNFSELNCILKSEIFVHRDGQLWELHVILGFNLISKHFQSPKHIIRAKDPRLALIDVAVPGFLTSFSSIWNTRCPTSSLAHNQTPLLSGAAHTFKQRS